jgi:hypothetical protein
LLARGEGYLGDRVGGGTDVLQLWAYPTSVLMPLLSNLLLGVLPNGVGALTLNRALSPRLRHLAWLWPLPPFGAPVDYGPAKVRPGCCFLLGDNRRQSKDSRLIGPIPMSDLHGIARMIFWSRERTFPDPADTTRYVSGPIQWERLGLRLDESQNKRRPVAFCGYLRPRGLPRRV